VKPYSDILEWYCSLGSTPLHRAAAIGAEDIVAELLKREANARAKNNIGK
jgi:ankyrin repeat protein